MAALTKSPQRLARRLTTPLAIAAGALLLRLAAGVGFANYDTLYALVWGQQLADGQTPRYDIPLAPTPHPLIEGLGLVLAPLPPHAVASVTVALGFLALSACGWAVYRLGTIWFNRPTGALAALLLLTRVPILSYGVRAYVDIPYLLLILGALIVESRRSRAGWAVLALLAVAGLLRPEAWVFAGLYWLYLALPTIRHARSGEAAARVEGTAPRTPRQLAGLALPVLAAPLIWMLSDWLITGNALWSLTHTRHTALALDRKTGLAQVPEYIPRRIGEILGVAGLVGAALGGMLALLWLRARALPGALAGIVAVLVFAAFAGVGLPINTRYAFLAAAVLCIFCGAAVCGWACLPREDPHRRHWLAAACVAAIALVISIPSQYHTDHHELLALSRQQQVQDDLTALVDAGAIDARCGPVGVPNHAPIPLLALWLRSDPGEVVSAQVRTITRGTYVTAADAAARRDYLLDKSEHARVVHVPAGFAAGRSNRSWRTYRRCETR